MTQLTEAILEYIAAYEMESIVAEGNVIKAHMEACMRSIQICSECEKAGIIMESDDWDGEIIPKRNDENILKYIFFFIPRIIINFCRKIKAWWEQRKQLAKDEIVAKTDAETLQVISRDAAIICADINSKIKGGGHLEYTGSGFVYMSRIKNPGSVADTYKMFESRFTNYRESVKAFIEKTHGGIKINPDDTTNYLLAELESGSILIDDLCNTNYETPISDAGFVEAYPKIHANVIKLSSNTIKAMQDVEDMYKVVLKKPLMSDANKTLAQRYMKLVDKVYDVFVRFENVVQEDLSNAYTAFTVKNNMIIKYRRKSLDLQDSPTKRKDFEEKLNKWGVK